MTVKLSGWIPKKTVPNHQYTTRELSYLYDDDSSLVQHARLSGEQGALVVQAIEAIVDEISADEAKDTELGPDLGHEPEQESHSDSESESELEPA
ncbi:MAG: hypothetical protein CMO26_17990 [Thiotrichales bacterium]|nr:hypothetical protein [Thiotrichales bacterium]